MTHLILWLIKSLVEKYPHDRISFLTIGRAIIQLKIKNGKQLLVHGFEGDIFQSSISLLNLNCFKFFSVLNF